MKLILTQDVSNLGVIGDTIDVKPGYGRNYLLPQGMALLASGKKSKELRHRLQYLEKLRAGAVAQAQEIAEKLKALTLEVTRKSGPGGRLFGSVTYRDLLELFQANGFKFERRSILLPGPIRNVGAHSFMVRVHTDVRVELSVKVIGQQDAEQAAQALAEQAAAEQRDAEAGNEPTLEEEEVLLEQESEADAA